MTTAQATSLVRVLVAAFPTQVIEQPTLALYRDHLRALPWRDGRTESAIRGLIASQQSPHLPAIGVVMAAVGVTEASAPLLVEAMRRGVELVPDLASRTGWAVGEARIPVPALGPDPAAALEPGPPMSAEQRRANLRRLGALARSLGAKKEASPPPTKAAS